MIAGWKVRRELARIGQRLRAIPEAVYEPLIQRRHDRAFASRTVVTEGIQTRAGKIALFLIYQPTGLSRSSLQTCQHLRSQGYAVLVVSNAPLAVPDRQALAGLVWKILERPNYGYDFGGYRDGIRLLGQLGITPEALLILNDSIWFPLGPDDSMIGRLQASGADLAGTILRVRPSSSRQSLAQDRASHGGDQIRFLESYLYYLPGSTFRHPAFATFWRDFRLTNNKYKVIRRGERDFSMVLAAAGLTVHAILSQEALLAAMAGVEAEVLVKTLRYGSYVDSSLQLECDALLAGFADDAIWRGEALAHMARAAGRGVFNSTFCYPTMRLLGAGFLKKSRERVNLLWRHRYLAAVEASDLPAPTAELLAEIRSHTVGRA